MINRKTLLKIIKLNITLRNKGIQLCIKVIHTYMLDDKKLITQNHQNIL